MLSCNHAVMLALGKSQRLRLRTSKYLGAVSRYLAKGKAMAMALAMALALAAVPGHAAEGALQQTRVQQLARALPSALHLPRRSSRRSQPQQCR